MSKPDASEYLRNMTWDEIQHDQRGDKILDYLKAQIISEWAGCHPTHSAHETLKAVDSAVIFTVDNLAGLAVRTTLFALGLVADGDGWYPSETRKDLD